MHCAAVLHGVEDTVTDPAMSQKLFDVAKSKDKKLVLLKDTLHAECMLKDEAYEHLGEWFSKR